MSEIRIEKHANGYAIHARDPGASKHNAKPGTKYVDPHKTFVFTHKDHVKNFLDKHMDTALQDPEAEYNSAFDKAAAASPTTPKPGK